MCKIEGGGVGGRVGCSNTFGNSMLFFRMTGKKISDKRALNTGDTNLFRKETRSVELTFLLKIPHTNIAIPAQVFSVALIYILLKHFTAVR